jgi:hypothetical protein
MATITCTNKSHKTPKFQVSGLNYDAYDYSRFIFFVYQNNILVAKNYVIVWSRGSTSFTIDFSNKDEDGNTYYGFNMLSPNTRYTVEVVPCYSYAESSGEEASVTFTTSSVPSPNGTITPGYYPVVKNQNPYDNCTAQALSTMLEVNRYKNNKIAEQYSVSFIYGSDGTNDEGMYMHEAIECVATYGSPRWELVNDFFPDNYHKSQARDKIFSQRSKNYVKSNANNQQFNKYVRNIDFYDTSSVKSAITTGGSFMFSFRVPDNFYNLAKNGIVPQPDHWSGGQHSIAIIGLTDINSTKYWIAQNSWGDSWGDNGLCYIPYDWGAGTNVPTPTKDRVDDSLEDSWEFASWTLDCYAPYFTNTTSNPYPPTELSVTQVGTTTQLNITWYDHSQTPYYMVMVRPEGSDKWTHKSYVQYSGTTTIDVEDYDTYEIVVISLNNSYACSEWSDIYTITITESGGGDPGGGGDDDDDEEGRPTDFEWTYEKESGGEFNLTAEEWEGFCDKIMAFLVYTEKANTQIGSNSMGLSTKTTYYEMIEDSYDTAIKGEPFTAEAFNYARYVIDQISTSETGIELQEAGDTIFADYLNDIVDSLNAIE